LEITGRPENVDLGSLPENMTSTTFDEYTNPTGFSISYPVGSEIDEEQNAVFFTIPQVGTSYAAAFSNINQQLDQFVQDQINTKIRLTQNFELTRSADIRVAGYPGHIIEYKYTSNVTGTEVRGKAGYTIVDNTAYAFDFTPDLQNFENATPIMNRMLNSLKITQPSFIDNQIPPERQDSNNDTKDEDNILGLGGSEPQRLEQRISALNFLTYRHPTLGFTIDYPEAPGLDVDELDVGVSFPHSKGTYNVLVSRNMEKSLDEFASEFLQGKEKDYPDFKLIDQTSATVAGHPAIRTEYTFTGLDNGIPLHALEYNVLFDGDGYILAFNTANPTDATLDDFRAVVQKMLDSFQFPQRGSSAGDGDDQEPTSSGPEGFGSSGGSGGFGQENDGGGGFDPFGPQSPDEQDGQDQNGGFGSEGSQRRSEQNGGNSGGGFDPFG
jgi:hypothetical protein